MNAFRLLLAVAFPAAASAQPFSIDWHTIDAGGTTAAVAAGPYTLSGTMGHPVAGRLGAGSFGCVSGFWGVADGTGPAACYANCDGSTNPPVLNVNDFICFQSAFAAGSPYANCDGSTNPPVLNVNDFICFQSAFAAGCP